MRYEGFVAKISSREIQSKRKNGRSSTAYSFKLENADGTEQEDWIGFGFEAPPFKEGDYISVDAERNEAGYLNYTKGTGQQIKNPPARSSAKRSATAGNADPGSQSATAGSGDSSTGAATADRQTQIVLQHSQEMAISAAAVLLANDALPMTKAQTPAGTAKRFDEVRAMVDKLTRKFYDDVVTGQLLKTVAPEIQSTEPDAPLPQPATERPKQVKVGVDSSPRVNETATQQPGVF